VEVKDKMDSKWISTGIDELDALLGKGSGYGKNERGIQKGNVALIRGEPGSGKTTLVLQILSNYLKACSKNRAVLFSLEEHSEGLLERMKRNFYFQWAARPSGEAHPQKQLYCVESNFLIECIARLVGDRKLDRALRSGVSATALGLVTVGLSSILTTVSNSDPNSGWIKPLNDGGLVVAMDSIDALMGAISYRGAQGPPRILLKAICDFLRCGPPDRPFKTPNTLLLTSEYHYHSATPTPAFTDSFYCDVEVLLRPEPVCVPEDYELNIQAPVGYNLNALIRDDAKSIESRSFCRILKSRASTNQSRRCAYDIVTTKGIQFFETYPGDGKIILFAENEPQRTAWNSFFERDVPDSYPALRHEVFDRMSMQTVYEGQRRLRNIPLKTDMYLSSFDSYWVGWYRSFKLKSDLHSALEPLLRPMPSQYGEYCGFVNSLVRAFRTAMPDLKGVPREYKKRQEHVESVIKEMENVANLTEFTNVLESWASTKEVADHVKKRMGGGKRGKNKQALTKQHVILESLVQRVLAPSTPFARDYSCFLQRLPFVQLRLFGEKRSGILPELIEAREPFRGIDWVTETKPSRGERDRTEKDDSKPLDAKPAPAGTEWLSIPYDANIGFFVYRKDMLQGSRGHFSREKVLARLKGLVEREQALMKELLKSGEPEVTKDPRISSGGTLMGKLEKVFPFGGEGKNTTQKEDYEKCIQTVIGWAADRILEGEVPKTWEEVIVLCEMLDKKLLIETKTFDSYMCTLLEMIWNSGGHFKVHPDYAIEEKHKLYVPLLRALHLLDTLFDTGVLDRNATVSPLQVVERGDAGEDDWLFARHWYSTLIEYLTAKDESGRYLATASSGAALEIMPVPVSLSRWADELYNPAEGRTKTEVVAVKEALKKVLDSKKPYQSALRCAFCSDGRQSEGQDEGGSGENRDSMESEIEALVDGPTHHSCWGDWSFGLLAGSENRALAIDLINNMMGSIKTINRAFAGACVPTVTEFYEMFGDIPCVHLPERTDIGLPISTYEQLRTKFFKHAKTRNDIYDFMHCAKILHGQVEFLRRTKDSEKKERNAGLVRRCRRIIRDIESLYDESILISPGR
jgi:KaiC